MKPRKRKLKADDLEGRFAMRVEEARKRAGLGIIALAKRSNCSPVTIVHLLHCRHTPCLSIVRSVAAALGVEVFHLLESKREEFLRLMREAPAREVRRVLGILSAAQSSQDAEPL